MDFKPNLTSKAIINKVFSKNVKGYDALEVDVFLDQVAKDYAVFDRALRERDEYIAELETLIKRHRDRISLLEIENAKYSKRLGNIKDEGKVSLQNIEYLKRIDVLEKELYRIGVDPSKLK
ncbi:MAG: DivIVA domain-containing protein [Bacilli bacterium]|nr:DivIVA domain-containing protein [Bacilli bacterium]MDD4006206.1 DivIVA domain-containing protein [Bacilli bacterium]